MSDGNKITIGQLAGAIEAAKKEAIRRAEAADSPDLADKFTDVENALDEGKDAVLAACKADATFAAFEVLTPPLVQ